MLALTCKVSYQNLDLLLQHALGEAYIKLSSVEVMRKALGAAITVRPIGLRVTGQIPGLVGSDQGYITNQA